MPVQGLPQNYSKEVGALLKAAREEQSLDCSEIALKIALSPSQLRFLEEGKTEPFYNHVFYLQAIRRYGEFLGVTLPEPELINRAPTPAPEVEPEAPTREAHHHTPLRQGGKTTWAVTAVALGVVAIGIFSMLQSGTTESPARQTPEVVIQAQAVEPSAPAAATPAVAATPTPETATPAVAAPPAPTAATPTVAAVAAPAPTPAVANANEANSSFVNSAGTWVQIVSKDGSKTNLRPAAGEVVEFDAQSTAAIAFGRPGTAKLMIRGTAVQIDRFLVQEASPARALVILREL